MPLGPALDRHAHKLESIIHLLHGKVRHYRVGRPDLEALH